MASLVLRPVFFCKGSDISVEFLYISFDAAFAFCAGDPVNVEDGNFCAAADPDCIPVFIVAAVILDIKGAALFFVGGRNFGNRNFVSSDDKFLGCGQGAAFCMLLGINEA